MRQVASRQRTIAIYGKVYVRRAADPAQPDSQVDLRYLLLFSFWKRGQRAGAGGSNQSILQK